MKTEKQFLNEITIHYNKRPFSEAKIATSREAEKVARKIYSISDCQMEVKEYFFVLFLNRANQVLGYIKLGEGGITGTVADIRLALATALKGLAVGMIIVHNHPSGNLNPSASDIELTRKFRRAGELMDISILDHLILTSTGYYSFSDNGL